jgi:glycosyltransferase involved in cell wall biosynthesis
MSRIVVLARKLDQGGAERQLVTLAKGLRNRGHDIQVVLFYSGGVYDAELAAADVQVHFVGKRGRWDVIGFLVRLALLLRRLRPATIYSFLDLPNILAVLLHPVVRRPRLVWSIRAAGMEMQHYDWLSRSIPKLEALLSRYADIVIANSEAGAQWAAGRGFPRSRVVVVENGIDTQRFRFDPAGRERYRGEWGIGAGEMAIGLVARFDPMKSHETFLRAAGHLAKQRDDLRFVCVGGGQEDFIRRMQALSESLGIAKRVTWAGAQTDMPAVYSALDIASSSSSFGEGFSNAVAEAMACERPCVVTDVGDSARIVGSTGEVVPPRNPEALAAGLLRLLDRLGHEPDLGHRARQRIVAEFSVERMLERTEQALFGRL